MKTFLLLISVLLSAHLTFAQKTEKTPLTLIEVKHNGISHSVKVGDTIHLGFGAEIDGAFRYIFVGGTIPLAPRFAMKSGVVTKLKYFKSMDHYAIFAKGSFGNIGVEIIQAVGIGEVIGFNDTYFREP